MIALLDSGYLLLGFIQETTQPVPLWIRETQTWADIFQKLVTALAIPIGAWWAYRRFFKERTHASRLQPTISGTVSRRDGTIYLRAVANVQNIGQTKVDLDHDHIGLRVLTREAGTDDWNLHSTESVFEEQDFLEPNEIIGEPVWVEILEERKVALRLDLYVAETATTGWLTREVVDLLAEVDNIQKREQINPPGGQQADLLDNLKEGIRRWWHSRVGM